MNIRHTIFIVFLFFVFLLGISLIDPSNSKGNQIEMVFSIPPRGYPPYLINKDSGILMDVLKKIAKKNGYFVVVKFFPEKRAHRMIKTGLVDVRARAKEWTKNSESFIYTDPVVKHVDVLIYLRENPIKFKNIQDLFGKDIGTIVGYTYPVFEEYFADRRIYRNNTMYQDAMLGMLLKKRIDCAIINKLVALWTIKQNKIYQGKFAFTDKSVGTAEYCLVFTKNKNWQPFVDKFNDELTQMKKTGELTGILDKYK